MHTDAALLFNAIPIPTFVVDREMRVRRMNDAAACWLDITEGRYKRKLGGEVLRCLHAGEEEGCGKRPSCADCVIRGAVLGCLKNGVVRKKTRLQRDEEEAQFVELLVTTSAYEDDTVLLIVEDVTELAYFQDLVPICMDCKKVRNDEEYWQNLDSFLSRNAGIDLTHGLCPSCFEKRTKQYRGE